MAPRGSSHLAMPDIFNLYFRALQSAIDNTGESGRVIIGSWYGGDAAKLRLGIDFHRSHISLKASQVFFAPSQSCKTKGAFTSTSLHGPDCSLSSLPGVSCTRR